VALCCAALGLEAAHAEPSEELNLNPVVDAASRSSNYHNKMDWEIQKLQKELKKFETQFSEGSKALSLNEVVELALKNNPALQASIQEVKSSNWLLTASQQSWYPVVSLSSLDFPNYGVNSTYSYGTRNEDQESLSVFKSGLNAALKWTFLDPQRQPQINTSYYQLSADQLLFYATARETISNAQIGYFNLQGSIENINDYQQIVAVSQQNYDSIVNKFRSGYANLLQVEQIKTQLELDFNELISYYIAYSKNAALLSRYVGLVDYTLIHPSDPLQKEGKWNNDLSESLRLGLSNNELIQQALAKADQNKWKGFSELNKYLPKFSISLNSEANQSSSRQSSFGTYQDKVGRQVGQANAFLGFEWQLFNGGIYYSNANSFFSQQQQSLEQSRTQSNLVVSNVRSNYASLFGSSKSIKVTNRAYRSAQIANDAATMRYRAGLDEVTTIVQTVQFLGRASLARTSALVDYNTAISKLYLYTAVWPANTYAIVKELLNRTSSSSKPNHQPSAE
jgi:outer membrane protein TolC